MPNKYSDDKKVSKTLQKVMKLLNKSGLNIPELLLLYGQLGCHMGASIAGLDNIPPMEEVKRSYYSNPTVDSGLILQGLTITAWEQDYIEKPVLGLKKKDKE